MSLVCNVTECYSETVTEGTDAICKLDFDAGEEEAVAAPAFRSADDVMSFLRGPVRQ